MTKRMRIKIIDEVQFCCKKMREYYESHKDIKFDTVNYLMYYEGSYIDECPFCGTDMEIDVSTSH
jgi:biotin synthase-related radical SAM superfamily protein